MDGTMNDLPKSRVPRNEDVVVLTLETDISVTGNVLCISPPYTPFLKRYALVQAALESSDGQKAWESLDLFLRENAPSYIWRKPEVLERGARISFDQLWTLFSPDDKVVLVDNLNHKQMLQFVSLGQRGTQHKNSSDLEIVLWGVWWNPAEARFERKGWELTLESFTGTKAITSLPVYPARYLDEREEPKLIAELVERGKRWRSLVWKKTSSYNCKGIAFVDGRKQNSSEKLQRTNVRILIAHLQVDIDEGYSWMHDCLLVRAQSPVKNTCSSEFQQRDL